jgi:hypothetical protein
MWCWTTRNAGPAARLEGRAGDADRPGEDDVQLSGTVDSLLLFSRSWAGVCGAVWCQGGGWFLLLCHSTSWKRAARTRGAYPVLQVSMLMVWFIYIDLSQERMMTMRLAHEERQIFLPYIIHNLITCWRWNSWWASANISRRYSNSADYYGLVVWKEKKWVMEQILFTKSPEIFNREARAENRESAN